MITVLEGANEYWLLEPEAKTITVFTRPSDRDYETIEVVTETGIVRSMVFPEFQVNLAEIFA